jgi:hypothetical protein
MEMDSSGTVHFDAVLFRPGRATESSHPHLSFERTKLDATQATSTELGCGPGKYEQRNMQ